MIDSQYGANWCAVHVDDAQRSPAIDGNTCECKQAGSADRDGTEASRDHPLQIVADTWERGDHDSRAERVGA
jgi:hypothetical protein